MIFLQIWQIKLCANTFNPKLLNLAALEEDFKTILKNNLSGRELGDR